MKITICGKNLSKPDVEITIYEGKRLNRLQQFEVMKKYLNTYGSREKTDNYWRWVDKEDYVMVDYGAYFSFFHVYK